MKKSTRYLLGLCIAAVAGVFVLQLCWINNYYLVNKANFEKEANMAFEDALKKDFSVRCDTIQHLIAKKLMDTAEYKITSEFEHKNNHYIYTIANAHNLHDKFISSSFYYKGLNKALVLVDTIFKKEIAERFAYGMRSEDLENHIVYYRTQNLGKFMVDNVEKFDFDTARLRPLLTHYLAQRDIKIPFRFYLRELDSVVNRSRFDVKITNVYPIITKAYPTYKRNSNQKYVRTMFTDPFSYIISRMGFLFGGSILLIGIVAFSLFYLLRSLYREKKLSAIKNDFISNITHEFKTPIATVSAAIEALDSFDALENKEKTQRYLTHSKNELKRLSDLVDKVLNISLYEDQKFDIKPEPLNINETIKSILNKAAQVSSKPVNCAYNNNSGIEILQADILHFQHAIINVVDNAIKYGNGRINIIITCTVKQNYLIVEVKDNGKGVTADNLPYVFEKFYRVPTNHHQIKGHGLGLSYVKSIIEKHNGWCKMESEYGVGSVLYLAWPIYAN